MNIKDLILVTEEDDKTTDVKKTAKVASKPEVIYSVAICSGCDFAISRKTARSEQLMVMLPSQSQFYFKNGDIIKPFSAEEYTKFAADLIDPLHVECNWTENGLYICKGKATGEALERTSKDLTVVNMLKEGYGRYALCTHKADIRDSAIIYTGGTGGISETIRRLWLNAKPLVKYYISVSESHSISDNWLKVADVIYQHCSLDDARYFIDNVILSSVNSFDDFWSKNDATNVAGRLDSLLKLGVQYETRRLVDYILYDSCRQGLGQSRLSDFLATYHDAIKMQLQLYDKVKDKYPEYLASYHDKLSYLAKLNKQQIDAKNWALSVEKMSAYEKEYKDYIIICPKTPQDMYDEATQQQNCLASYVQRVTDGEQMIFFLRKKKSPEESLVTIQLWNSLELGQVYARNNTKPTDEQLDVVHRWNNEIKACIATA